MTLKIIQNIANGPLWAFLEPLWAIINMRRIKRFRMGLGSNWIPGYSLRVKKIIKDYGATLYYFNVYAKVYMPFNECRQTSLSLSL